jgi:hypothetical protein
VFQLLKTESSGQTNTIIHNIKSPFQWIVLSGPLEITSVIAFFISDAIRDKVRDMREVYSKLGMI